MFYPGTDNSILYDNCPYRFTRSDLEKCTILIPDLKLVQPGDLVVKFNDENEPHLGIVIKTLWDEDDAPTDVDELMEKIYLISIRRGFRMVLMCTWGNPGGMFGGFADNPKEYTCWC